MKAIRFALGLLIAVPSTVYGQYEPTITIIHAVANNRDDPAGAKEIALKDKISASCDGKSFCIYKGPELGPNETFRLARTKTLCVGNSSRKVGSGSEL